MRYPERIGSEMVAAAQSNLAKRFAREIKTFYGVVVSHTRSG
jgi:hypothetical protein